MPDKNKIRTNPSEYPTKAIALPSLEQEKLDKLIAKIKEESAQSLLSPRCVALSFVKQSVCSHGGVIVYGDPLTNVNAVWYGNNVFVAPKKGLYFIALDFVKDTGYNNGSNDDAIINICKNGTYIAYAWAGEMEPSNPYDRATGAVNLIVHMNVGDWIRTDLWTDGGVLCNIANINFSIHSIC